MTVTFVTNFVHHHQLPLADEFFKLIGNDFHYIATHPLPDWLIKGGYDPTLDRSFIIRTYLGKEQLSKSRKLIDSCDVVIMGAAPNEWVYERKKANKVTFHYSERWLKKITYHTFSPKGIFYNLKNYTQFRNKRTYMLCASAYAANDVSYYFAFPNKCYKWGYFIKVSNNSQFFPAVNSSGTIRLMWCARFLALKHPELAIQLAARLKKDGYNFVLDMYGSGDELDKAKTLVRELMVSEVVHFCGNLPNEELLVRMKEYDIFLFTSDRNEGWGAVLSEAMSNGCAVVASKDIGSAPFLINDGKNGLLFNSIDLESLYSKVKLLIDDDKLRRIISENAINTMQEIWNPRVAAERFLHLSERLLNGLDTDFADGPCSKAIPI